MRLRKNKINCLLFILISVIILCIIIKFYKENVFHKLKDRGKSETISTPLELFNHTNKTLLIDAKSNFDIISIAVVACGQRLQETLILLKSAILFNKDGPILKLYIITEDSLKESFQEKLSDWKASLKNRIDFEILSLSFPVGNAEEWKGLFKPCAAQRLFLPTLLKNVDSVLYMDTDTIFLSSVIEIWSHFGKFNSSQFAGLSSEHEDKNVGWYNRFARHPFYGPMGVNSGVMLMNLTRMRQFQWEERIIPIHDEYKMKITWGDQDLINILFFFHPENLYIFPCTYNYRPDHCMYMSVCNATDGVQIIHGNRGYFHSDKQPVFKAVYNSIENYQIGKDPFMAFLEPLSAALEDDSVVTSNCGKVRDQIVYKSKKLFLEQNNYYY